MQFKVDTEKDDINIQDVNTRTDAVLPTVADIGASAGKEYKALSEQLKTMYDQQVTEAANNGFPNCKSRLCYPNELYTDLSLAGVLTHINSIGVVMYCKDQAMYNRLEEIDRKLTGLWAGAENKYSTAVQLNSKAFSHLPGFYRSHAYC